MPRSPTCAAGTPTSGLNGCRFCFNVHSRVACGLGIDEKVGIVGDAESYGNAARLLVEQGYARRAASAGT